MSQFHRKLWAGRRDESPVLCHGDFLPEHIFVGPELEITALIDFGDFFGGHPSSDLILLAYWPRAVAESAFAEGYPGRDWFGDSMAKRRSLARLGYLMGYCAYLADTERVEEFAFIRERLRETLESLSTTTSS